ncbi:hypothetical protein LUZ60_002390 [Juncus effusus]|nr:hypothetical protein LUZ60_002390 [Juncus effusus]
MAVDSWLSKFRSAVSPRLSSSLRSSLNIPSNPPNRNSNKIGILAFEISSIMSKILHLWQTLTDSHLFHLRFETISSEGVQKVVSDDESFLLSLACAELTETLRIISESISTFSHKCTDPSLREFRTSFREFANYGLDKHKWAMSCKEMDSKIKKMDRLVSTATVLHNEIDNLSDTEHCLKKLLQCGQGDNNRKLLRIGKISTLTDLQQKIFLLKQEVKRLKQTSLWGYTFDSAVLMMARSAFTVLARIKHVFGLSRLETCKPLYRSISISAIVHPTSDTSPVESRRKYLSGPLFSEESVKMYDFFESNKEVLKPPPLTLGESAVATHYANLVVTIEKMVRSTRSVEPDTRDNLYGMLTASVKRKLRERLRGVEWGPQAIISDRNLAAEWKCALHGIIAWLGPMAHATIRWQAERSFEQRRNSDRSRVNVLLLQTLHFANREKVEAAIVELLVGLNYVWRFEREMEYRREMLLAQMESEMCKNQDGDYNTENIYEKYRKCHEIN